MDKKAVKRLVYDCLKDSAIKYYALGDNDLPLSEEALFHHIASDVSVDGCPVEDMGHLMNILTQAADLVAKYDLSKL